LKIWKDKDITIQKASEIVGINTFYFCRLFKKLTGKTFIHYLNFVRISVSEKLLLTTNMPITVICEQTGFSSLSYCNRIFRAIKLSFPSEYRKNMMEIKNNWRMHCSKKCFLDIFAPFCLLSFHAALTASVNLPISWTQWLIQTLQWVLDQIHHQQ